MAEREHRYQVGLTWENATSGTVDYRSYSRDYRLRVAGKPDLVGSADPTFRGDPARHNPEDLLVGALAACHMLSYLALCARHKVTVTAYRDDASGTMVTDARGAGRFAEVVLRPRVTIAPAGDAALAGSLHERAHRDCFIAASCNFPVRCQPVIERG